MTKTQQKNNDIIKIIQKDSKKVLQKIGMTVQKSFDKYVERRNRFEQVDQFLITHDKYYE